MQTRALSIVVITFLALTVLAPGSLQAQTCGDGEVQEELGEECDDGGGEAGDGCSAACLLERCGDVNDDDAIDQADVAAFRLALAEPLASPLSVAGERKCGLILDPENEPRPCDLLDVAVLRRALRVPPLPPGIDPVCAVGDACAGGCPGEIETLCDASTLLRRSPICVPDDGEAECEIQTRVLEVCSARAPSCEGEVFTTWRPTCNAVTETCGHVPASSLSCLLLGQPFCSGSILATQLCVCAASASGGCTCTGRLVNCTSGGEYCITPHVLRLAVPGGTCIAGRCTSTIDVECPNGCHAATATCF